MDGYEDSLIEKTIKIFENAPTKDLEFKTEKSYEEEYKYISLYKSNYNLEIRQIFTGDSWHNWFIGLIAKQENNEILNVKCHGCRKPIKEIYKERWEVGRNDILTKKRVVWEREVYKEDWNEKIEFEYDDDNRFKRLGTLFDNLYWRINEERFLPKREEEARLREIEMEKEKIKEKKQLEELEKIANEKSKEKIETLKKLDSLI